jgi:hypothetical protein
VQGGYALSVVKGTWEFGDEQRATPIGDELFGSYRSTKRSITKKHTNVRIIGLNISGEVVKSILYFYAIPVEGFDLVVGWAELADVAKQAFGSVDANVEEDVG